MPQRPLPVKFNEVVATDAARNRRQNVRKFEMWNVVQLNGLIREAEQSGETRYLAEMKTERARKIRDEETRDAYYADQGRF